MRASAVSSLMPLPTAPPRGPDEFSVAADYAQACRHARQRTMVARSRAAGIMMGGERRRA